MAALRSPKDFDPRTPHGGQADMRSLILWGLGIPIPIILLLAFCTHHF
jgi:hypothetical protein